MTLKERAQQVSEIIERITGGWYWAHAGKRAIQFFKGYEVNQLTGRRSGYQISRSQMRQVMCNHGTDLDTILECYGA